MRPTNQLRAVEGAAWAPPTAAASSWRHQMSISRRSQSPWLPFRRVSAMMEASIQDPSVIAALSKCHLSPCQTATWSHHAVGCACMSSWRQSPVFHIHRFSSLGYAMQLVLGALQLLVNTSAHDTGTVPDDWATDLGAVVAAAREAADGAGRDAALALLAALARAKPADALQHVLEARRATLGLLDLPAAMSSSGHMRLVHKAAALRTPQCT